MHANKKQVVSEPHAKHLLAHKYMEKLEDSFVGENVQDISRLWIDDWQPVDLIFE